ncbi:hypothetical protein CFC21_011245 [Triticum aestivum]|uniref:Uncharacterized protein n=2 Tax=Triticum aestivum TaxID=4565 RepID=A0A3B5ZS45_WHEAT|nr:hypothetical protein CFC21_011245 [Triticum aestivum]
MRLLTRGSRCPAPSSADRRGRSPPPSPRSTSAATIELRTPSSVDRLRRVAPCFGAKITPDSAFWSPSLTVQNTEALADPDASVDAAPFTSPSAITPVFQAAGAASSVASPSPVVGTPLFVPAQPPLLPAPSSIAPRALRNRRKTLAGVQGFNLSRRSPRLREKKHTLPIAQLAEQLLCRRLGIVADGEPITEAAIGKFVDLFHGELPDIAVAALRALFQLDCDLATAVEEALIVHGGEDGPDLQDSVAAAASASA